MPDASRTVVVIEGRDLDTDARSTTTFDVEAPMGEAAQRAQLADLVGRVYPQARLRSFGNSAASFLDSTQLVVAHYRPLDAAARQMPTRRAEPVEQQPLFAS